MKIAPYVEKLNSSQQYSSFAKEHRDAFMVAGFFVLDFEAGQNVHQIDYYIPSEKKVAAFTLDHGVSMQLLGMLNAQMPEHLDLKTKIDLDALKGILQDEMKNRNITDEVKKIIAVIQSVHGRKIWSVNCVLSGMGILRASIEDDSQTVLKMEKSSLFDYIKKIPGAQLAKMQQASVKNAPPEALEDELKKLDKIEEEIVKKT
jgi:hypothetical protein